MSRKKYGRRAAYIPFTGYPRRYGQAVPLPISKVRVGDAVKIIRDGGFPGDSLYEEALKSSTIKNKWTTGIGSTESVSGATGSQSGTRRGQRSVAEPSTSTSVQPQKVDMVKRATTKTKDKGRIFLPTYKLPKLPSLSFPTRRSVPEITTKWVKAVSAGSTYSTVVNWSKGPKAVYRFKEDRRLKEHPKMTYEALNTFRKTSGLGLQGIYTYCYLTNTVFDVITTDVSLPSTGSIFLENAEITYLLSNNSDCNMFLQIWDGFFRRSTTCYPSTAFQNGLIDEGLGPAGHTIIGQDPLKSRTFCQLCNVTNVTKVELREGKSHQHKVITKYYRSLNKEYWSNTPATAYQDFSRFTMFILRGAPVHSLTNPQNVTTGTVALDAVSTVKLNYKYVSPTAEITRIVGSLPTVTDPVLLSEATGQMESNILT